MNKVILVGRLGNDPESKATAGGTSVTELRVATTTTVKGDKLTEWHNVVTFGKTAENAFSYLSKGREVLVEGKLQTRSWEGKDGVKRYKTEVAASNVQFLGDSKKHNRPNVPETAVPPVTSDDIPF